jgi:hypothetical protein
MPNVGGSPGPGTEIVNAVLGHVTKAGVIGGGIYVASQIALGFIHHSWEQGLQAVGYAGLLMAVGGAAFSAKKVGDVVVAVAAEQRIAAPGPSASAIPAVQREIEKQEAGTSRVTNP